MSNDEIQAAKDAIQRGDLEQAKHHLINIDMGGAHPNEADEIRRMIWYKENATTQTAMTRIVTAFSISLFGYALLSILPPAGWNQIVWGLLAFFALPALIGLFAGHSVVAHPGDNVSAQRFKRGFLMAAIMMAVYSLFGMTITRAKMMSADKSADMVVFLTVAAVYALVAGCVAGMSATVFHPTKRSS